MWNIDSSADVDDVLEYSGLSKANYCKLLAKPMWKTHELYEREVEVLKKLDHPHIAKYIDHFEIDTSSGKHLVLVQEFIDAPNIAQELGRNRPFKIGEFFTIPKNQSKRLYSLAP